MERNNGKGHSEKNLIYLADITKVCFGTDNRPYLHVYFYGLLWYSQCTRLIIRKFVRYSLPTSVILLRFAFIQSIDLMLNQTIVCFGSQSTNVCVGTVNRPS